MSAETFATLHAPLPGGDYGMGWIVTERGWAGGRTLTHGGSNTLWFVTVWIAPEKDMAFFAATNAGGDPAFQAVDKAVEEMIGRHLAG
ncbi:MAG: serine hydrolase [Verrucomicrobia subdivision 3 bacterium]|nr:serine hydrolase [Limisphaerales bacterium]